MDVYAITAEDLETVLMWADEDYETATVDSTTADPEPTFGVYGEVTPLFVFQLAHVLARRAGDHDHNGDDGSDPTPLDTIPEPSLTEVTIVLDQLSTWQRTVTVEGEQVTTWLNLHRA